MLLDSRQVAQQNPHVVWRALLPLALGVLAFGAGSRLVAQFSGNGAAIFGRGLGGGLILFGAFEAVTALFVPLRRRGAALALSAAFIASALVHAYQTTVALGGLAAVAMATFFMVQPPLMMVERWLGVRRWPAPAGFLWTFGLLFTLAPLLIEPVLPILLGR